MAPRDRTTVETSAASTDGCASSSEAAAAASACESASRVTISGPSGVLTKAASGTPSPLVVAASVRVSAAERSAGSTAGSPATSGEVSSASAGVTDETATTNPAAQAATRHMEEVTPTASD